MVSLSYPVIFSTVGIDSHLLVSISMPEWWEWTLFTCLLFPDPFKLFIYLLFSPLCTTKNYSFSGREKSMGVTAGYKISSFQISVTFISGILNFLPRKPKKLYFFFSLDSSSFLTSQVQDVVGVQDREMSVPFQVKSLISVYKRQADGALYFCKRKAANLFIYIPTV